MTDATMTLRELLEKGSAATFLREMIGFAANRLMELEMAGLCGVAPGETTASSRLPSSSLSASIPTGGARRLA